MTERMMRTLLAVALFAATAPALAADAKKPKPAKTQTVTTVTPEPAAVAVVAPAPFVPDAMGSTDPAPDRPGFSAGALVGIGASGFGFGLGARAGYTLPFHLYLGGGLDYFFGSTQLFTIGPEVGYDLALPVGVPLLLRPYVGFGLAHTSELGVSDVFLFSPYPGIEFEYQIVPHFFAGLDIRVPFFTTGQATASFNAFLTAGYKM